MQMNTRNGIARITVEAVVKMANGTIENLGVFDASTSGNLYVRGTFSPIGLSIGEFYRIHYQGCL